MAAPLGLQIKTRLEDMSVGDCIACRYTATTANTAGTFSELGTCVATEIPITGSPTPDGCFYFIKVDTGLLISDRVVQNGISWINLNDARYIQGTVFSPQPDMSSVTTNATVSYTLVPSKLFNPKFISTHNFYASAPVTNPLYIQFSYPYAITISSISIMASTNTGGFEPLKDFALAGSTSGNFSDEIIIGSGRYSASGKIEDFTYNNTNSFKHYRLYVNSWHPYNDLDGQNIIGIYVNTGLIRSLTSGCAFLGTDRTASKTDCNLGAWPITNEWDKYIVKSSLKGKIIAGDDNIWHWSNAATLGQDIPIKGLLGNGLPSHRMVRALSENGTRNVHSATRVDYNDTVKAGFRPVLQYLDAKSKATTLWY